MVEINLANHKTFRAFGFMQLLLIIFLFITFLHLLTSVKTIIRKSERTIFTSTQGGEVA